MGLKDKFHFLICVVLLHFAGYHAQAQDEFFSDGERTFYGGLVGGANFTQVDGDTYEGFNKVGLNVGGIVYARFNEILGGSMELIYTQKGSRGVSDAGSAAWGTYVEKYYLNLNYVEVPIVFHFLTNRKLHYEIGASYSRLVKSSEALYSDPGVIIDPNVYYFHKSDFSIIGGGAYRFYKSWFIEGRFQYSLSTIRDQNRIPFGGPGQYNNVASLRLIYFFSSANPG